MQQERTLPDCVPLLAICAALPALASLYRIPVIENEWYARTHGLLAVATTITVAATLTLGRRAYVWCYVALSVCVLADAVVTVLMHIDTVLFALSSAVWWPMPRRVSSLVLRCEWQCARAALAGTLLVWCLWRPQRTHWTVNQCGHVCVILGGTAVVQTGVLQAPWEVVPYLLRGAQSDQLPWLYWLCVTAQFSTGVALLGFGMRLVSRMPRAIYRTSVATTVIAFCFIVLCTVLALRAVSATPPVFPTDGLRNGLLAIGLIHMCSSARAHARMDRDCVCRNCGYDLSGNVSGRCPECGTTIASRTLESHQRE